MKTLTSQVWKLKIRFSAKMKMCNKKVLKNAYMLPSWLFRSHASDFVLGISLKMSSDQKSHRRHFRMHAESVWLLRIFEGVWKREMWWDIVYWSVLNAHGKRETRALAAAGARSVAARAAVAARRDARGDPQLLEGQVQLRADVSE